MNSQIVEINGRTYPVVIQEVSQRVQANNAALGWDAQGIALPPRGRARLCGRSAKTGQWKVWIKA